MKIFIEILLAFDLNYDKFKDICGDGCKDEDYNYLYFD